MNYLVELHYLPSIPYFAALQSAKRITLERHEYFEKQTFRNRCHILTSQGEHRLIVPVSHRGTTGKVLITEIKIDYSQKWLNNHWRAIESAYRNAPFFEYYADDLHRLLFARIPFLYDLNLELLTMCLKWLQWNVAIQETMTYEKTAGSDFIDLRNAVRAKKDLLQKPMVGTTPYRQVFGSTFVEGLSILDLVFCEGPNARHVVQHRLS